MAFEELIGNEKIKESLMHTVQANNILHSYLFTGIDGIGKRLFAKEFAKMILCTSNEIKPCKKCKSCLEFQGESHPDFLQIIPEDGKTIKIEQIRYLQKKVAEKPVASSKKVYIINDCDTMTREASNALLKTLEEPPTYATIILITSNESKLLLTIKSRCTKISFQPLSEVEIREYLEQKNLKNNEKINSIATENVVKQCQGSIGRLLKIQEYAEIYEQIEKIIENLEKENITQIWKNAEILYKSKENILDFLDYINILFYNKLMKNYDIKYTKAISIVEEAKKKIVANSNFDMTIDNLLLKLWEEIGNK